MLPNVTGSGDAVAFTERSAAVMTMKSFVLLAAPPGLATLIGPLAAARGTVA